MNNSIKDKVTILLCTCDTYEDLWFPFFKLFDKHAGELKDLPIVINTETKEYSYPGLNIKCINQIVQGERITWAKRLKDVLARIETEYVLFLLDDFFLVRDVKKEDFEYMMSCVQAMEDDKDIGAMNLIPLQGADNSQEFMGFWLVNPGTPYRMNAQACIWRKEVFDKSLLDIESPWEWEIYGNLRNDVLIKSKIFALAEGQREPYAYGFYDYSKRDENGWYVAQSGVMRGKWYMPSVENLFRDNDINVDFSKRGVYREGIKKKMHNNKLALNLVIKPYRKVRDVLFKKEFEKIIKENEIENEKNMEKFVYPYIKENL